MAKKGQMFGKYSQEFKLSVILDMRNTHLGYRETVRKYWNMSRKGNCLDNSVIENFSGRLKVEMFYGEKFESVNAFIEKLKEYIYYYNNERISLKLKGMRPVKYRTHYHSI